MKTEEISYYKGFGFEIGIESVFKLLHEFIGGSVYDLH